MKFDYRKNTLSFNGKKYSIDEVNRYLMDNAYNIVRYRFTSLRATSKGLKAYIDWKYLHSLPEIQIIIISYLNGKDRNNQGQNEGTQ